MSTGQIVFGFIGGVIGAYFGGPYGALIGASIGMTIGGWIDPPEIDYTTPDKSELQINTSKESIPLPDLLGTTKVSGNIISYWGNRSEKIEEEVGGKGGGQDITTGYKYYQTWEVGICEGVVNKLHSMYRNQDKYWAGDLIPDVSSPDDNFNSYDNMYDGTSSDEFKAKWKTEASPYGYTFVDPYIYNNKLRMRNTGLVAANFKTDVTSRWMAKPNTEYTVEVDFTGTHGELMRPMWRMELNSLDFSYRIYLGGYTQPSTVHRLGGNALVDGSWVWGTYVPYQDPKWTKIRLSRFYDSAWWMGGYMYNSDTSTWQNFFYGRTGVTHFAIHAPGVEDHYMQLSLISLVDQANDTWVQVDWDNFKVTSDEDDLEYDEYIPDYGCDYVDKYGQFCFFNGTNTQESPATISGISSHNRLKPYRHLSYAHFEDNYIGKYNAVPTMNFVITKRPSTGLSDSTKNIGEYSYNPIHAIYYILMKCGLNPDWIDTDNFNEQAQLVYDNLSTGVNVYMGQSVDALGYIKNILKRIDAILYYSNSGQFKIKILDQDVAELTDPDDMISIGADDLIETPVIDRPGWINTINQIGIEFNQQITSGSYLNYERATQTAVDLGNVETTNKHTTLNLSMGLIDDANEAARVAIRELMKVCYPIATFQLMVDVSAFELQVGDSFLFNYDPYDLDNTVLMVTNIQENVLGDDTITMTAVEDLRYLSESVADAEGLEREDEEEDDGVVPLTVVDVIEAPYYAVGDNLYVLPVASREVGNETGYHAYISNDGISYNYYSDIQYYTETGVLNEEYPADTMTIDDDVGIEFTASFASDMNNIETTTRENLYNDTHLTLLKDGDGNQEIISWEQITASGSGVYSLSGIVRGRYDTVPTTFSGGSKIYFMYNSSNPAISHENLMVGATTYFKFIPYNAEEGGLVSEGLEISITPEGRAFKPYVPYSFFANGTDHNPTYTGDITLTWTDRYRLADEGPGAGFGNASVVVDDANNTGTYYSIDIHGAGGTTNYITQGDSYTYTSAQNTTDNGGLFDLTVTISGYNTYNATKFYSEQRTITVEKV